MDTYVSLDRQAYEKKPGGEKIGSIKYRIIENWKKIDVSELADAVGNRGTAMIPARLENGISEKNCRGMQVFALDFDHGSRFEEIKQYCDSKEVGLPISFAYHTYSSSKVEERFRIVFIFESLIEDVYAMKIIMAMLHKIFPQCDQQCKNLDRMFWGGKELIYLDESAHITLVQLLNTFYNRMGKQHNGRRNIQNFCSKYRIFMLNHFPAIGPVSLLPSYDDIMDSVIIHRIGESTKSSFFILEEVKKVHQSNMCIRKQRKLNLKGAFGCRLLEDFKNGKELDHFQKFALITNLRFITGGEKWFLTILSKQNEESYEKWIRAVSYMKGYRPMRCQKEICPYWENCDNAGTILDTLFLDRKVYREAQKYYSLDEASKCLRTNLENAFQSTMKGIHLIPAQTALGKTTAYIQMVKKYKGIKFLIALPTNILKNQVWEELYREIPGDVFVTPSIHGNALISEEIRNKISWFHKVGLHNKTKKVMKDYYEKVKDDPDMKAVAQECQKILKGFRAIKDERVIVTTHAYFLQLPESFLKDYTIIIDEDILQLQIFNSSCSVNLESIEALVEENIPYYSNIARRIMNAEDNTYYKMDGCSFEAPAIEDWIEKTENLSGGNLTDLIHAKVFVKIKELEETKVYYFCPPELPNLKYIILSATLNVRIYEKYFRGSMLIRSYDEKKAEYQGKLIQYTYHSLGRGDLKKKMEVFDFACELSGKRDLGFITFKYLANEKTVENKHILAIHFGNSSGINSLSGKDLGIVGTPYKAEQSYKLIACYLGADVNNQDDMRPRVRRVQYAGASFLITTYKDELLREVQLYAIQSELEQCVGRARLLRKDCTVYLFSAFPCEQAEIRIGNYIN